LTVDLAPGRKAAANSGGERRNERRRAIIEAAEALFLEQGYEATSLAAVVKRSGGSLATLYELFGNKQGLLRAIIEWRKGQDLLPACGDGCPDAAPADLLRRYAHQIYAHVTSPTAIALKRIVITEALSDPAFASRIYDDIHLPSVLDLAELFERLNQRGDARIDNCRAAAELFFAIVMSDVQLRMLADGRTDLLDESTLDWRLAPFINHFGFREAAG
jgi:TetR/AcrR family transcriptional repressor of mexJK operon